MYDPTDLAGRAAADAEAARDERQRREAFRAVLRRVLSSDFGREFCMSLLENAGIYRSSYNADAKDVTEALLFNEGRRNAGLWLMSEITEHAPEHYITMFREHAARKREKETE